MPVMSMHPEGFVSLVQIASADGTEMGKLLEREPILVALC
jgi:hypothetical protein